MSPSASAAPSAATPSSFGPLPSARYLLRFESLFHSGRGLSFPCDAQGHVDLDQLSERARDNYLFARTVIGHEFATPVVLLDD